MKLFKKKIEQLKEAAREENGMVSTESLKALSGLAKAIAVISVVMLLMLLLIFLFPIVIMKMW